MSCRVRRSWLVVVFPLLVVALVGSPFSPAPAAVPRTDPNARLVVAQASDVTTLDPNADTVVGNHNVIDNMFDSLLDRSRDGKFVPSLALSWRYLDSTNLKFFLRANVKFHDGNPFTAADVKFTLDRILGDKQLASKMAGNMATIKQVVANDDRTVTITTSVPDPELVQRLTEVPIVSKAAVEKMGLEAFARNPVGTGPFRFVDWRKDQYVTMERFDGYWRGTTGVKTLVWRPIPEPSTQVSELQTGGIDIAYQNITVDQIPQIQRSGNRVIGIPSARLLYGVFNMAKKPFDDKRVRQAVTYAIDVNSIIRNLLNGHAYRINEPVDSQTFGYDPTVTPYPYDPARAKQLLAEAGYPNGFQTGCEARVAFKDVIQVVAQQLAQVGVKCNIVVDETTVHLRKVTDKTMEPFFLWTWANSEYDADSVLYHMMRTGQLYSMTSLPALDALVDRGHVSVDAAERLRLYHQAMQVVKDEAPVVSLYQTESLYGLRPGVNWQPRPDERADFMRATKEPAK